MTQSELIQNLLEIPDLIHQVEREIVDLEEKKVNYEFGLEALKADVLLREDTPIVGKNELIRMAQLHVHTQPTEILIADLETKIARQKVSLRRERLLHQSYLAIAQLLAAETIEDVDAR